MEYQGKLVLAPMVRVGTNPTRLLAARYGADIVYSEELVDKRVIASMRRVNEALGTVDFLDKGGEQGGRVMFRTSPEEQPRLVFQLGTADAVSAVAAAQLVAGDVAVVDVNMGCPKQFSLQGGMGAALLKKPEVAEDILKSLRRNLQLPVSCKIRLLDDPRDTVELARRLAACGISALAVHGRTTQQRPRDPAAWEPIKLVVDALAGLPVIANGDVMSYSDAQRVRQETGCAAAMVARAAMWNASVFRPQGFLPLHEVQREYMRLALRWDNALPNTKYCLKEMADAPVSFPGRRGGPRSLVGHEGNTAITRAKDGAQLCALLGLAAEPPYQDLESPGDNETAEAADGGGRGAEGCAAGKRGRGGGGKGPAGPGRNPQQQQNNQQQQSNQQQQKSKKQQRREQQRQAAVAAEQDKQHPQQEQQVVTTETPSTAPEPLCAAPEVLPPQMHRGEPEPGQQGQSERGQDSESMLQLQQGHAAEQQRGTEEGAQSAPPGPQAADGCNGAATIEAASGEGGCEGSVAVLPLKRKREEGAEEDGRGETAGELRGDAQEAERGP